MIYIMKLYIHLFISFLMLNLFSLGSLGSEKSHELNGWAGNKNFWFSLHNQIITVEVNKEKYETFSVKLSQFNLIGNSQLYLKIKSYEDMTIQFQTTDGLNFGSEEWINVNISSGNDFQTIILDFSTMFTMLDQNLDIYLIICLNPGKKFKGVVFFKDLNKSDNLPTFPVEQSIFPNPTYDTINIQINVTKYTMIDIYDISGNQVYTRNINPLDSLIKLDISSINSGSYIITLSGYKSNWSSYFLIL